MDEANSPLRMKQRLLNNALLMGEVPLKKYPSKTPYERENYPGPRLYHHGRSAW